MKLRAHESAAPSAQQRPVPRHVEYVATAALLVLIAIALAVLRGWSYAITAITVIVALATQIALVLVTLLTIEGLIRNRIQSRRLVLNAALAAVVVALHFLSPATVFPTTAYSAVVGAVVFVLILLRRR